MNRIKLSIFLTTVTLLLTTACSVYHDPRPAPVYLPRAFIPVGHRGGSALAPENTMAAFQKSARLGVAFELDVMFCGTGELVVIHDANIKRLTGKEGIVAEMPLAELRKLDIGSHFDKQYSGERIATLGEVLDAFGNKVLIDIEIKTSGTGEKAISIADAVAQEVRNRKMEKRVFVSAFNPYVLERLKQVAPELLRAQLYSNFEDADLAYYKKVLLRNLFFNENADPDLLVPRHTMIDADYMQEMRGHGYGVFTWTVNTEEEMDRLIRLQVGGIITDKPDLLLSVVKRIRTRPEAASYTVPRSWAAVVR